MDAKKKIAAVAVVAILVLVGLIAVLTIARTRDDVEEISIYDVLGYTSVRKPVEDVVVVSDAQPNLALVGTPFACWYNIEGAGSEGPGAMYGLKPFLVTMDGELTLPARRFLDYTGGGSELALGNGISGDTTIQGTPAQISLEAAKHTFESAAGAIIVEDTEEGYELGVEAAPMASYLNIPVIILDDETGEDTISGELGKLDAKYVIILGPNARRIAGRIGMKCILLEDGVEINLNAMPVIEHRFGRLDYITMTNPRDVVPPISSSSEEDVQTVNVNNINIRTANVNLDVVGESKEIYSIDVPDGLVRVQIYVNFTSVSGQPLDPLKDTVEIEPMIFATMYDEQGRVVANAPSFSLDIGRTYIETTAFNCSGSYSLEVSVHYGIRGFHTFFGTDFGLSRIEATYDLTTVISQLAEPHNPLYPDHSMMAPYTTAARGGLVVADSDFGMTNPEFASGADGYGTGPWYETGAHEANNAQVDKNVQRLNDTLLALKDFNLYDSYFSGPAWLSIMAGHNMIPQYYVPKEASWVENPIYGTGWPTDVPYSMDVQLSVARTLAFDVGDLSALIARTLYYEPYAEAHSAKISQEYGSGEQWKDHFHFLAGELGGRTGWFFWQRHFAQEIEDHGFIQEQYYQEWENDRQTMIQRGAYERANYFDMMLHGNWYWYCPEINGVDEYSTAVKVTDIIKAPQDWELGPSMYISGTCLLGRIDGVPSRQSITMAFIHAGINNFFSASRSTGPEAKAGTVETTLLYDDISVGEAWRADKTENTAPAAFYVRNLFGDPAFNPYEPENGYANQGRPVLVVDGGGAGGDAPEEDEGTGTRASVGTGSSTGTGGSTGTGSSTSAGTRTGTGLAPLNETFAQYFNYDTLTEELHNIANAYPNIVSLTSLATTYEGREMWAVKVSDFPHYSEEDEAEILFTGAHHGREWPSYMVPMYTLRYIVDNYGKGPTDNDGDGLIDEDPFDAEDNDGDGLIDEDESEARISWLVDNRQIWFVPMVNPDGVSYAHMQRESGHSDDNTLWRKNREPNVNPLTGEPYPEEVGGNNMWGVDLNRNYGFHWGEVGFQGMVDPSREDYAGPRDKIDDDNDRRLNEDPCNGVDDDGDGKIDEDPRGGFSATETKAIKALVEDHDFSIAMNFHTYTEKIYWPYMWTLEIPPDEELFFELAKAQSVFNGYEYRNMSERNQDQFSRHPPVDGDTNDWMYGVHGILSFCIELGQQFIEPEDTIIPMGKMHLGPNLLMIEYADNPSQHKIRLQHEALNDTRSTEDYPVKVRVSAPDGLEIAQDGLVLHYSIDGEDFEEVVMEPAGEPNVYVAYIPGQPQDYDGHNVSYYITVEDEQGHMNCAPSYAPYEIYNFDVIPRVKYTTAVIIVLIIHIVIMFVAIGFLIVACGYGAWYLWRGTKFNRVLMHSGIATGFIWIGGFPLGWLLAQMVFGAPWFGIPFGMDITDNKTLVIFLYWFFSLLLVKGSVMNLFANGRGKLCPFNICLKLFAKIARFNWYQNHKKRKDYIERRGFVALVFVSSIVTVALYLVPHSIETSPWFSIFLFALTGVTFGFVVIKIIQKRRMKMEEEQLQQKTPPAPAD